MHETKTTPKPTYCNLPAAKRERIIAVALAEFAAHGYQRASLNSMVKTLAIAKGSFYQYFDHKEALFFHVFEHFTELVKELVRETAAELAGKMAADLFAQARAVLWAGLRFIDRYPDYYRIYLQVLFDPAVPRREELLGRVRLFSRQYFAPLCAREQQAGRLRADISIPAMVFFLDATIDRLLQAYARPSLDSGLALAGQGEEELARTVEMAIEVLRTGLAGPGAAG